MSENLTPAGAQRFCTQCGSEIPDGTRFCTSCGQPLPGTTGTSTDSATESQKAEDRPRRAPSLAGLAIAAVAVLAVLGGMVAWLLSQSATRSASSVTSPTSARPSPTETVTQAAPTVTATVTATATRVATVPASTPTGAAPQDWPSYQYAGPAEYDVCDQSSYPLSDGLSSATSPAYGSPEYWTVVSLQAGLHSLKYGSGSGVVVDGMYGPQTAAAVRSFQTNKGLTVDGLVGPQTWGSLHQWVNNYPGIC